MRERRGGGSGRLRRTDLGQAVFELGGVAFGAGLLGLARECVLLGGLELLLDLCLGGIGPA